LSFSIFYSIKSQKMGVPRYSRYPQFRPPCIESRQTGGLGSWSKKIIRLLWFPFLLRCYVYWYSKYDRVCVASKLDNLLRAISEYTWGEIYLAMSWEIFVKWYSNSISILGNEILINGFYKMLFIHFLDKKFFFTKSFELTQTWHLV